jgi:small subunit ribosomal protein S8
MDKVADMLTVIRNAQAAGKPAVAVPYSALKYNIAKILERRGYVATVEKRSRKAKKNGKARPCLEISLKYVDSVPAITGCEKVSRPGQRIYVPASDIKRVKQGKGIGIISTSKGLMTEYDAKKQNIGGEMLCQIW